MDISTKYMGLELKNPLVASSSPLTEKFDNIKKMEDAGVSAVVLFSLFEEQLKTDVAAVDYFTSYGADSFGEALSYFPDPDEYNVVPSEYLNLISKAVKETDIPIIGSLNGVSNESWVKYAKLIEEAGAHGLELNSFYTPTDLTKTGRDIEKMYMDVVKAVKSSVNIPVALKLNPFFSSMGNMATQFDEAGVDALVLFNRFYQPDFDLDSLEVINDLKLSDPNEIRLPLLWIAVLSGKVKASLGATTGVHSSQEIIKYIMAGADVAMVTSSLLINGIGEVSKLLDDFNSWLEFHEYESVEQMRGSMSQSSVDNPEVFERANYIKVLKGFNPTF